MSRFAIVLLIFCGTRGEGEHEAFSFEQTQTPTRAYAVEKLSSLSGNSAGVHSGKVTAGGHVCGDERTVFLVVSGAFGTQQRGLS